MKAFTHLFRRFVYRYFDMRMDIRMQAFHLLAFDGILSGLVTAALAQISGAGSLNTALNIMCFAASLLILIYAKRTGNYENAYCAFIVSVFVILFPLLFFSAGGYISSMPLFFVAALVFTSILLRGILSIVFLGIESGLYIACMILAYLHENLVKFFKGYGAVMDIFTGIAVVSTAFIAIATLYVRLYENHEQELEKADQLKTEFLGNMSHELKTPLTSVLGFAKLTFEMLEEESELSEDDLKEMTDNLRLIIVESERMKRIVEQLLDIATIEQGKFSLSCRLFDVGEMAKEIGATSFKTMDINENSLIFDMPPSLPKVFADADRIRQVFLNLLANASRHTKEGLIRLSAHVEGKMMVISVADTGEGIDKELQKSLFMRYLGAQVGRAAGTGLGLYNCKAIVEAHGGSIWLDSEPGIGTTVNFSLPLSPEAAYGG